MSQIAVDLPTLEGMIYENLKKDKKRIATGLRFVLVRKIGSAKTVTGIKERMIRVAIKSLF